jgi:hypothetical protein
MRRIANDEGICGRGYPMKKRSGRDWREGQTPSPPPERPSDKRTARLMFARISCYTWSVHWEVRGK